MTKKIMIIAWRWLSLSEGEISEFPVENDKTIQTYDRRIVRIKEPDDYAATGKTIEKIKAYIASNCTPNDEILIFLHTQKQIGKNGYTQESRYKLLEKGVMPYKIRCFMFGDNCLLYRYFLLDGDFRTKRFTNNLGNPKPIEIFKKNPLTHTKEIEATTFNTIWQYYAKQYVEHAEYIRALFKNCLNHWVVIPDNQQNQRHYLMSHWRDTLSENEKLYGEFERFLKFSPKHDVITKINKDTEEQIYQRSIAYIASDPKAKQAYEELKRIITSNDLSTQKFSLQDIWQRMDSIRKRIEK